MWCVEKVCKPSWILRRPVPTGSSWIARERQGPAACAFRDRLVVLGGWISGSHPLLGDVCVLGPKP
eukprot:CAMPEP_0113662218 /NCGR_PEP_ID=MMETSP0038_2-20120614/441_1 /TAXON_ID=2898 /ORGANISM="Cryptomonas paramecium" /LENGTH=65 /DNA_ID=CAMNT_0000577063 /DNA_START=269 /DNA_END=462 /DNA_ORIENTATION=+ /assembly_acc=CAM_ASM_000170